MTEELKPCPFCGSKEVEHTEWGNDNWSRIACPDCGVEKDYFTSKESAFAWWNRRSAPAAQAVDEDMRKLGGKLIQLAASLLDRPIRTIGSLLDEDKRMTRQRVSDAADRLGAHINDAAYEIRRVADALHARAALAAPVQSDAPYPDGVAELLERNDWTPEDALRFYAEGKHFDTVNGRTRIIDTGSVASNALKHLSLPYLEMKGDAELAELREAVQSEQEPVCYQARHSESEPWFFTDKPGYWEWRPLYAAPVRAVKLPDRLDESQYRGTSLIAARRWNACLDEVTRLNAQAAK